MSLATNLLEKLKDKQVVPLADGNFELCHSDEKGEIKITAEKVESLGSRVIEIEVKSNSSGSSGGGGRNVVERAKHIAENAYGLLEPLKVLEYDQAGQQAIIRSVAPLKKADSVEYYEVELDGDGQAKMGRYESANGEKRKQIPFTLTHEVLAKMAETMCGV